MIVMAKVNPVEFWRQSVTEWKKVTWPSGKETRITTLMVFFMVVLASIFFLLVDAILSQGIGFVLGLGS